MTIVLDYIVWGEEMKPVIGVTPLFDEVRNSIWMLPGYLECIKRAGGIPIILPLESSDEDIKQIYNLCNGFLFTGGQDINPSRYGEKVTKECGEILEKKDELESNIFKRAYEDDKCVLGICRGLHLINTELGGTLYQDLPSQFKSNVNVEHNMFPPYDRKIHDVYIQKSSPLYEIMRSEIVGVNSYHHQGIKKLGDGLEIMALSPDNLIEAVCCKSKRFVWGVQWHPEYLFSTDENSEKIFKAFIKKISK